jgi:hypothetical protein
MTTFHRSTYDTHGPFNIPMKDAQARALDAILKTIPDAQPKFIVTAKAPAELLPGERADISWISTEDIDRDNEIVIAKGMDDSHFKLNPIVTLQHCYALPPVGRSVWRKKASDGQLKGIKAKTQYPKRPSDWPGTWPPDAAFELIRSGLLVGKSIGFLPTKSHAPSDDEIKQNPALTSCRRIIDQWLLLEYACVYLPCQQNAVVEAVSKGVTIPDELLEVLNIPKELLTTNHQPLTTALGAGLPTSPIPFTTLDEIHRSIERQIAAIDFKTLAQHAIEDSLDRARGRV